MGIEYSIALIEKISGMSAGDSPLLQRLIEILTIKEAALPVPDLCRITGSLGQSPSVYAYLFDLFADRADMVGRIPKCIYSEKDSLADLSCAAWCRFMLEQGYKPVHERTAGFLLEKKSPVEEIRVLQLALSALYLDSSEQDTAGAARSCIFPTPKIRVLKHR
ncbi:MAG: hypothetical protein SVR04_02710 [Spirochaetota bacterium]|nr:hypothetical protein [Spirochaetota bacterium]